MTAAALLTLVAEIAKVSIELAKLNLESYSPEQRIRLAEIHLTFMEWQVKDLSKLRKLVKLDEEPPSA